MASLLLLILGVKHVKGFGELLHWVVDNRYPNNKDRGIVI